ncbi:MAG: NAD(P)H-dependent oxidoreductase [Erythrobacter sp.]
MQNKLLIIWHSRTGASEALARAVFDGAVAAFSDDDPEVAKAILKRADETEPADILSASAYVFVCPENLAAISGLMKDMFDRCYYPVLGQIEGRSYATIIAAGSDGQNAQAQIDRIATGWRLKRIADPMIVNCHAQTPEEILTPKKIEAGDLNMCREIGAAISHGLEIGVY